MALVFTGCTKLDVIDPAGDVEQLDYRALDGDDMDVDDDSAAGCGGDDVDDDDEDDDTGGITDEDDDEDEDDSDTQRGSTSTI